MTEQVRVPACNVKMVEESIAKLNKRAEKYDIDSRLELVEVSRDWEQVAAALAGEPVGQVEMVNLTLSGEPPQIEGYRCLATLEVIEGDCYVHPLTSAEVPARYRQAETAKDCEHCNFTRNRNETFLLEKDSKLIQVGSTCLEDFTGTDKAKLFAQWARIMTKVRETIKLAQIVTSAQRGEQERMRGPDMATFLARCCRAVKMEGAYRAKSHSRCTADVAWQRVITSWEDSRKMNEVLNWVRFDLGAKADDELNDYQHNLVAACRHAFVNPRLKYIVASAVTSYNQAQEMADYTPGFIGEVGKQYALAGKVVGTFFFRGKKQVVKFKSRSGKAMVYFAGQTSVFTVGKEYTLKATIGKHETFRGVDTTTIQRIDQVEEV